MKLMWTASFTVDTGGVLIRKSKDTADGAIPSDIDVAAIYVEPVSESDIIEISGIKEGCAWLPQKAGRGYLLERIMDDDHKFMLVRAPSGTVAVHLHVEGS